VLSVEVAPGAGHRPSYRCAVERNPGVERKAGVYLRGAGNWPPGRLSGLGCTCRISAGGDMLAAANVVRLLSILNDKAEV